MAPHRICILGTTGSGKTTLARKVSQQLGIPRIELDALNWEPHWTKAPTATFRQRVTEAVESEAWVTDGNYRIARDLMWTRATMVVWLDYPAWLTFSRLFRRTMKRLTTHEWIWGHSQESWRTTFLTQDSLFVWFLKTYGRNRREIPALLRQPEYAHLQVMHLHRTSDADRWLSELH